MTLYVFRGAISFPQGLQGLRAIGILFVPDGCAMIRSEIAKNKNHFSSHCSMSPAGVARRKPKHPEDFRRDDRRAFRGTRKTSAHVENTDGH
ncbi:unnamed protein product [Leptosia nina]|uniref:Uncharacterized protein n=1 Tax=Leptosia nina TaxID=320188 RepID=A0AAV1JFZ7_9NEOP